MRPALLLVALSACGVAHSGSPGAETAFDLAVRGHGFDGHDGQTVHALVRRSDDGAIVGDPEDAVIAAGHFALGWAAILEADTDYELDFYVTAGGACTDADVEAWRYRVSTSGQDVALELGDDHASADHAACVAFELYTLAFTGSGYTQHNGEVMQLVVLREPDGHRVAGPESATPVNGAIFVQFPAVLQAGFRYDVDYYADHNDNGACDAPPVDHEWRVPFGPVTRNTVVNHSAGNDYTDVCDAFP